MMTRKDYVEVSRTLCAELHMATTVDQRMMVVNIARSLADVMARDNDRFDRQRFYDAVTDGCSFDLKVGEGDMVWDETDDRGDR